MFEAELQKRSFETYIAEHIWLLTGAVYSMGGSDLDTPRYTELIEPKLKNSDNRTAREIIDYFINKL